MMRLIFKVLPIILLVCFYFSRNWLLPQMNFSTFKVKNIWVEGRFHMSMDYFLSVLDVPPKSSIWLCNPWEIKQRLEQNPWIRKTIVERKFPDTLKIRIFEREPIAIWQWHQKKHLVDEEGKVIPGIIPGPNVPLPVIMGQEAPEKYVALKEVLKGFQKSIPPVRGAVFSRSGRWDLYFLRGVKVKMPDSNLEKAFQRLVKVQKILHKKNISSIDLRFDDVLFVEEKNISPSSSIESAKTLEEKNSKSLPSLGPIDHGLKTKQQMGSEN